MGDWRSYSLIEERTIMSIVRESCVIEFQIISRLHKTSNPKVCSKFPIRVRASLRHTAYSYSIDCFPRGRDEIRVIRLIGFQITNPPIPLSLVLN